MKLIDKGKKEWGLQEQEEGGIRKVHSRKIIEAMSDMLGLVHWCKAVKLDVSDLPELAHLRGDMLEVILNMKTEICNSLMG